jgi:signal transduction histidine kinase
MGSANGYLSLNTVAPARRGGRILAATKNRRSETFVPLLRFGLLALVPVVALGAVLAHELNVDVQQRYLDTERSSATLITQVGIQPLLNEQQMFRGMTADEIAQTDHRLQSASLNQEVVRLKVWNDAGTVVYSDNHALITRTFPIDDHLRAALNGHSSASITDGSDVENSGDNLPGPLIQVYVPLIFPESSLPSGAFELYLPYAPVQAAIDDESTQLYLVLAVGLALFYASMFPIVFLVNRWRRRAETTALANLAALDRLNRLKSEFLIRISHQFRTSMVGIEGFSEVIRDSEQLDPAEMKGLAADIFNDAQRLDRAFNEMIELDKMETGHASVKIVRSDLNHLIEQVVGTARTEFPTRNITTGLGSEVPIVQCDEAKMTQVMNNLVTNALKYSRGDVAVSSKAQDGVVEVSVRDSGPGMPPDFDSRLFVGRISGSGGTGLGLPIARQIVEMHGGRIWFESASGKGTVFHFTLPVRTRPTRELKPVARP